MRQAGVIAAAGIVALERMVDRLAEDHANAQRLAAALAGIPGLRVDTERARTNMVYADVLGDAWDAETLTAACAAVGVLFAPTDPTTVRLVTHYGVTAEDVDRAARGIEQVMRGG